MTQLARVGRDGLFSAIRMWEKYYADRGEFDHTTYLLKSDYYMNGDGVQVKALVGFSRVKGAVVESGEVEIGLHPDGLYRAGKCVHFTTTQR